MKEIRVKILIGFMSFALIGLTSIQWYWIQNSIDVETERFENSIKDAMAKAATSLSKKEAAQYVFKVFENEEEKLISIDSANIRAKGILFIGDTTKRLTKTSHIYNELCADTLLDSVHTIKLDRLDKDVKVFSYQHEDSLESKSPRRVIQTIVEEKNKIVREVVNELVYYTINSSINERINENAVYQSLRDEFFNRGYNFDFEFNVDDGDSLIYTCDKEKVSQFMESKFSTKLFPDELLISNNRLFVLIPDEGRIILQSILVVLLLSLFFTSVIILIFYKTITLFLRQKKVSELKDDLINNITHEFKTPISTISLAVESINEPGLLKNPSDLKHYSGIIKEENNRLQAIVDTLLNTALLERGEYALNKCETDLHDLINSVIDSYSLLNTQNNVVIDTELNSKNSMMKIDSFHFTNILSNIIDNSIKYNIRSPKIFISTKDQPGFVLITISDNGIGMEKNQLDNIFDTFYRVPTGNIHNVKGYGIGLSYVKKMVAAHGGSVIAISTVGEGTTLEILLPNS